MTKTEKMFALVEQWKQSGKTRKEFCGEREINPATFSYWVGKKKRSDQAPASGFARIDVSSQTRHVEIIYPNGVKITTEPADLNLICQLIKLY